MPLLEFYGTECPHCIKMMPIIDKLIAEGFDIKKHEVWHDEKNAKVMEKYDTGLCGGVPFFFNTDSKQFICGEADEAKLRKWAKGEKV
jgi:thiol-disulfide isomerase/thioredoxin